MGLLKPEAIVIPKPDPFPKIANSSEIMAQEVHDRAKEEEVQLIWTNFGARIFLSVASAEPAGRGVDRPLPMLSISDSDLTGPDREFRFDVVPGGALYAGPALQLTGFQLGYSTEAEGFIPYWSVSGLEPFSMSELVNILTDSEAIYERYIALFDGDTTATGTAGADRFDLGAGDDVIQAGDGDDVVFRWQPGNLDFRGGAGRDILYFETDFGDTAFPTALSRQLVVDLAKGTGKNPYGGTLSLKSVEVIHDTPQGDRVLGSKADETIISDRGGGNDVFRLKGGDDDFQIAVTVEGTVVNGGTGTDSLLLWAIAAGSHRLDLARQSQNTGVFAGAKVSGIEEIRLDVISSAAALDITGTTESETVSLQNFFYRGATLKAALGGGDDTANGGFGNDILIGGNGDDSLFGNSGDDTIRGGAGADILNGGTGNDRLLGEAGGDVFVFANEFGHDRVIGYQDGLDKFDFTTHTGIDRFLDLKIRDTDLGVKILDGEGGRIDLAGVDKADLDKTDFLF